jgi:hypothetical protein
MAEFRKPNALRRYDAFDKTEALDSHPRRWCKVTNYGQLWLLQMQAAIEIAILHKIRNSNRYEARQPIGPASAEADSFL